MKMKMKKAMPMMFVDFGTVEHLCFLVILTDGAMPGKWKGEKRLIFGGTPGCEHPLVGNQSATTPA